jgi:hypothetical protein
MIRLTVDQCGYAFVFTSYLDTFAAAVTELKAAHGTDFEGDIQQSVVAMVHTPTIKERTL